MKLDEVLKRAEEAAKLRVERKKDFFEPYPKQQEFFDASIDHTEIMLMAGNQLGKSLAAGAATAFHLTGEYPDYWLGRRWDKPTRGWIAGESSSACRDIQQKILCGEPGVDSAFGTGMIPKDAFVDKPSLARGVTDAYDTIQVRHKSGGVSVARFKSYEQGRTKFQGETLDWAWCDEEPDMDIYTEILTRLAVRNGILYTTFTPLKGETKLTDRFMREASKDRALIRMTVRDVKHFDKDSLRRHLERYPVHERKARLEGVPMLGSGGIFTTAEDTIMEAQLPMIPPHWVKLWGIDFGIDHPFAAALMAWDRDNDVIHILHTIRMADGLALQHATAMKMIAAAVPVAWPHDGTQRDKNSGESLAVSYRKHGLAMLAEHATFPEGGYSTEAAIMEIQERMTTGRFKVANHLSDWFEEYRSYHRKDGVIVKERDDIMSATQKLVMMKRFARAVPLGSKKPPKRSNMIADGVDFDLS